MDGNFEMPNLKKSEEEKNEQVVNNPNKVEIPQEYYDKLQKEKEARLEQLEKRQVEIEMNKQSGATLLLIILNIIVFFALVYGMNNINRWLVIGIPIYIILGTIISCMNKKEESKFSITILVSCMIGALVGFLVVIGANKGGFDVYYAFAVGVVGFLGYILSLAITKLMTDSKAAALQKIFYIIIIGGILGVPYYFYTNYKTDFMGIIFSGSGEKEVLEAKTEEDFIERTLKNRYGYKFICNGQKKKYIDDITHRRVTTIDCSNEENNVTISVMSLLYDEDNNKYIVKDNYLDNTYIIPLESELIESIKNALSTKTVTIGFYPKNKCYFIGDCVNDDNYQNEMNLDNLYKYSVDLRLEDYLGLDKKGFFNKYGFEYNIILKDNYSMEADFISMVNSVINIMSEAGLENNGGFTITIKDSYAYKEVFKVIGKASADKSFNNYNIVDIK